MNRCIAIVLVAVAGCATTPDPSIASGDLRTRLPDMPINFSFERGSAALAVRQLDEASPINVVLMNGLEYLQVGPYNFEAELPSIILERIATDVHALVYETGYYSFIYPPRYEALLETSISGALSSAAPTATFNVAYGADTPLYNVLALLTHSTGYTIVADNAVAASLCGETRLYDVNVEQALDALFRSARLSRESINIDSQRYYTFVSSVGNRVRPVLLYAPAGSTARQERKLRRIVSLSLPEIQADAVHLQGKMGAKPLLEVLPAISDQLGITVTADDNLRKLPVNPTVISDVPLDIALKLIINQWLLPEFGYRLTEEGVHLMHVGAS